MKLGMYSIYDKLTGYMIPSFQQNDEQAERAFAYDLNSPEMSLIKANPEDFQLERVGYFDTDTGTIQACDCVIITNAVMVKKDGE